MDWSQPCEWKEGAAGWLKTVSLAAHLILSSALWISNFFYPAHRYLDRNNTFFFSPHTVLFQKIWCIPPRLYLPGRCFSKVRQKKIYTSDCWKVKCLLFTMQLPWQVFLIATSLPPSPPFLQTLRISGNLGLLSHWAANLSLDTPPGDLCQK